MLSGVDMQTIYDRMYQNRFPESVKGSRRRLWEVLAKDFFQRYISANDVIVDIGAGFCEFLTAINAHEKIAVDKLEALKDVPKEIKAFDSTVRLKDSSCGCVFMSNFLEHLKSKDEVITVLSEARRILKSGGRVIVLQPNIRYLYNEYWDFFDHNIPLSDKSVSEILAALGFDVEEVIPRFLPYTTRSKFPKNPLLVRAYLKIPLLWKVFGKQALILARKP